MSEKLCACTQRGRRQGNEPASVISGIGGVYKDITEVSPGSIWYQRAFGENPACPGTGGQDVEIVKQDPSGADVECVTNKTLVLVLSSWLVGVNLRNAGWGLFWDRCWQVHQGNHAPGNIPSSLRLGPWNQYHQSRSCGVKKTDCMELPACSDQDGVTSSGDIYTYRFPWSAPMSVACHRLYSIWYRETAIPVRWWLMWTGELVRI